MKALLALATALIALPLGSTVAKPSSDMPPIQYRGDALAVVVFTDQAGIERVCGTATPPLRTIACHYVKDGASVIIMPNPCLLGDVEFYAKIMCHEKGHALGWNAEHDN